MGEIGARQVIIITVGLLMMMVGIVGPRSFLPSREATLITIFLAATILAFLLGRMSVELGQ